jgi:tetratricopeptide (TPR) repeat protein
MSFLPFKNFLNSFNKIKDYNNPVNGMDPYPNIFPPLRAIMRKYLIRFLLIIFFLMCSHFTFSFQNTSLTDSLKSLLLTATDTIRINLLNETSKQYWMTESDSAIKYAQEALAESRINHYHKGEAEALRIMGWSYYNQGNKADGKMYVEQSIRIFEKIDYEPGLAAALNNIGHIHTSLGDYAEGLEAYQSALTLFRKLGNLEGEGSVLNYINQNYQYQGNYEKAIEYCMLGLEIRKKIQDHPGIAHSYNNMGNMYLAANKLKTALNYYRLGMEYAQDKGLPSLPFSLLLLGATYIRLGQHEEAMQFLNRALEIDPNNTAALNNMGEAYLAVLKYETSLKYLFKALSLLERNDNRTTLYLTVMNNISRVYITQKRFLKALPYAQKSHEISTEIGARRTLKDAAFTLSKIYAGLNEYARAYEYQQQYIVLKDTITSEDYTRRLAVLEANLELAKKQAHIEALTQEQQLQQQELKRQTSLRNAFIAGLGLMLVLGLVFFRYISLKRKADHLLKERLECDLELEILEKQQKEAAFQSRTAELEMMALRAQMNPHFIFNCLNSINRFILKNESEAASDYLTKFSKLIRLILQNSQSKTVILENELEALKLYLEMEILRFEGQFDFQISYSTELEIEDLEVPPLIIQPYVENAIWHGLMHKEDQGHLWIELSRENDILLCQITDDGIGRKRAAELNSKSASKKKSMGMQITAHRLELINTLSAKETTIDVIDLVDTMGEPSGTRVILKIPV